MAWKKCNEHIGCLACSECLDQYNSVSLLQLISPAIFFLPSLTLCTATREVAGEKDSSFADLNVINVSPLCMRAPKMLLWELMARMQGPEPSSSHPAGTPPPSAAPGWSPEVLQQAPGTQSSVVCSSLQTSKERGRLYHLQHQAKSLGRINTRRKTWYWPKAIRNL